MDVWRIQSLARHSISAIRIYLDNSLVSSLGNIAAEAATGRSLHAAAPETACGSIHHRLPQRLHQAMAQVVVGEDKETGLQVTVDFF